MKHKHTIFLLSALACASGFAQDVIIDNFESGNFGKWTVEGDAFGSAPARGSVSGQQTVSGFEGKFFANSFHGGDNTTGSLTSKDFEIQKDYVNFMVGGGAQEGVYIELVVDGETVRKSRPKWNDEKLRTQTWNVSDLKGKSAKIRIVDNANGGWGHILADKIEMSDAAKAAPEGVIVDDFESGTFDKWEIEGDAFGSAPSKGTLPNQQNVSEFEGQYLANSYHNGDDTVGALTSKEFEIRQDYINFMLGGGARDDLYIELVVDGRTVRKTSPSHSDEKLASYTWDVKELKGKKAKIKIVDDARGGWGHILADKIEMNAEAMSAPDGFVGAIASADGTLIDNFESGNFGKWTVEGDAFGNAPARGSVSGQQPVSGFEGKFFANSYHNGDDTVGALTSQEFEIQKDFINFMLGGGERDDVGIELIVDGQAVRTAKPFNSEEKLKNMSWDVKDLKGKTARIRIFDNARGGWGHILADNIEMSDQSNATVMPDYTAQFDANQKYILVPIDESLWDIPVYLDIDGKRSKLPKFMRFARNDKIDYYVPVNIEKYKGKKVALRFNAEKNFKNLDKITQSDTFEVNRDEAFRPAYHFSPPFGWMNDPNGMFYKDGKYHLYYQHNPYGAQWQNMTWGHAVSKDLVHWEDLEPAIRPDAHGVIYSGSAVVDKNNTSGFGENAVVAIYTYSGGPGGQSQGVAYSNNDGKTFKKYEGNPALPNDGRPDFRDPKVIWHEPSQKWIMSLATGQTISFYSSPNLKDWSKLSEFGDGFGSHTGVWECPDMFPIKAPDGTQKWVLFVSVIGGSPNGGSATQYFIGDFDGEEFKPDNLPYPLWLDYGRDNYAGVTWSNIPQKDGRTLFIGWMSNWQYAGATPTKIFRSTMTTPRELKLIESDGNLMLASAPAKELQALRTQKNELGDSKISGTKNYENIVAQNEGAFEVEMTVKPLSAKSLTLKFSNGDGQSMDFELDFDSEMLIADRSKSGHHGNVEYFGNPSKMPLAKRDAYKVDLYFDKGSCEIFINDGEWVMTHLVFPNSVYNNLTVSADGEAEINGLTTYKLQP